MHAAVVQLPAERRSVTAIVLSSPSFSPAITREMYGQLEARYPHSRYVGPFQLRWRE